MKPLTALFFAIAAMVIAAVYATAQELPKGMTKTGMSPMFAPATSGMTTAPNDPNPARADALMLDAARFQAKADSIILNRPAGRLTADQVREVRELLDVAARFRKLAIDLLTR